MRPFRVVVLMSLALPVALSAQRLPRGAQAGTGAGTGAGTLAPAPLPTEAPRVAQALAYKRSRWSVDGYTMINSLETPIGGGRAVRYTTFGAGTHAGYRYTDALSATLDMTSSIPGAPTVSQTVEVGTRYSPVASRTIRPYVDVRAGYMRLTDQMGGTQSAFGLSGGESAVGRYSRGLGGVTGLGFEYSLTSTMALTNGVSAMRSRMSVYNISTTSIGDRANFWTTTYRYALGIRFSPVTSLH